MSNFWVKAAIAVVVVIAVVLAIARFKGSKPSPSQEKTISDTFREDEKRMRAEPNVAPAAGQPAMKFRELTEEEQAGAEQLFEMAIASRKMARLPGMNYGQMVDYCRQVIEKYPGSEFDYKARRMLGEVPREQWGRYGITQEEIDGPKK